MCKGCKPCVMHADFHMGGFPLVLNRRAIKANARQFLTNGQWVHLFLAGIIIEAVNYINFGTSLYVQLRNTFKCDLSNAVHQRIVEHDVSDCTVAAAA